MDHTLATTTGSLSDRSLFTLDSVGHSFSLTTTSLGRGGHGEVFAAHDNDGKLVAIKCCTLGKTGIRNLLETSIMKSVIHPHLNRASRIHCSGQQLFIVMDIACTDLACYTRKEKGNHTPSPSLLRTWCLALGRAVACLHQEGIIHADIKASNVLLYPNESIKLSDFTLAVKKWQSTDSFSHTVCTSTHRPLECWQGEAWTEALDMWALGCTFYELAYGSLLFVRQKGGSKELLRQQYCAALRVWAAQDAQGEPGTHRESLDFLPPLLSPRYTEPEMQEFNTVLRALLGILAEQRMTVAALCASSYLHEAALPYVLVSRPPQPLREAEQVAVQNALCKHPGTSTEKDLAYTLYTALPPCERVNAVGSCLLLAGKLVSRSSGKSSRHAVVQETRLCHLLDFHLHTMNVQR